MPVSGASALKPHSNKRQRQASVEPASPRDSQSSPSEQPGDAPAPTPSQGRQFASAASGPAPSSKAGQSSNFRNVSACNRCRLRKNRCDQKLPSCASCAKAGVNCVGYDPITKKEIPRSYVFYLETRVEQLERLLSSNHISFPSAQHLELCSRPGAETTAAAAALMGDMGTVGSSEGGKEDGEKPQIPAVESLKNDSVAAGQDPKMLNIVSPSKPKSLASASGVSFARVVFAAVQYSVSDHAGEHRPGSRHPSGSGTSMRDSFFGLHTKPKIQPAPFPDKEVASRLVTLYFEHANPQIPILHRGEFMAMFEQAYANGQPRSARELYMLNMVFAIGCGVIVGEPVKTEASNDARMALGPRPDQGQPEEYHASAIVHLESCLSSSGGGLEVLQAVLLLANFALLRPVPPGLWYIIGVAVRLAVDLGLHYEEGANIDAGLPEESEELGDTGRRDSAQERGRRLWVRDLRRRLWWCTYSFDRLVSTCVGRPFGISDQVITTELPSLLDDDYITTSGFIDVPDEDMLPSYKHVAHHYFRLRLLQSEILQVLQYNQAKGVRAGQEQLYPEMHNHLQSPYLVEFDSFRSWRLDIDRRLYEWKSSAPTRQETGVAFSTEFLELNYWQAIIMLYRQSLSVPAMFEGEYTTSNEVNSPTAFTAELREDEDAIYLKVAEAGQKILRIYRQLHLSGLVSYTYLSTHHLFMAGISYLYAIWHSPLVRSRLTMDEVDFTVLAAKSVFTDMIDKCPPAETCRDAFDRTAKTTIKMASSSGGFGPQVQPARRQATDFSTRAAGSSTQGSRGARRTRGPKTETHPVQFDPSLSDSRSSSGVSVMNDAASLHSPPIPRSNTNTFDTEHYPMHAEAVRSQDGGSGSVTNTPMTTSPTLSRQVNNQLTPSDASTFIGQQPFGGLQGAATADYHDAPTMDFLHNLGIAQNGDFGGAGGGLDQAQLDLGFGMNWETVGNDYGEGQQMNPFDTFFFGAQQGGTGDGDSAGL